MMILPRSVEEAKVLLTEWKICSDWTRYGTVGVRNKTDYSVGKECGRTTAGQNIVALYAQVVTVFSKRHLTNKGSMNL